MIRALLQFYERNERWIPIVSFAGGFVFDAFMLPRIDEPRVVAQQAIYLLSAAILVGLELVGQNRKIDPPQLLRKIWPYREAALHFLLGTLLNAYTIFYFKSASALTSFVFIALLVIVLMLNEFRRFGKKQTQVHMAFFSLCLVSYLVSLTPIVMGVIGDRTFLAANTVALLLLIGFGLSLGFFLKQKRSVVLTHVLLPGGITQFVFVLLYYAHAIPPVPLSVAYLGIYHDVKRLESDFQLIYTRPKWMVWEHGDQTFLARPNDKVFCYARIFSPARFKDKLQVRWMVHDRKLGWQSSDVIPMEITGGRKEGYRGVTQKSNYVPGRWRVQIETLDNRELGRIDFVVKRDEGTTPREVSQILE